MREVLLDRFEGDGDGDEIQIEVLDENQVVAQEPDDKVSLTKEEYAELKRQTDATARLTQVFGEYAKGREPINQPVREVVEDEGAFEREIEAELFSSGKTASTLKKAIEKFGGKYIADLQNKIAALEESVVKQNIRNDPLLAEYGDEVTQYLAQLPPSERGKKQAVDWAVSQVKLAHMDDIVAKKVAEALAQKTNETTTTKVAGSPHMDRGGVVSAPKKVVNISPSEAAKLSEIGMPKEVYAKWSSEQKAQFRKNHGIK